MSKYSFRKFQPLSLRFWHWLNAMVILGLLGTVLIRKTFLSWRTNSVLIEEKLKTAGTVITPELAKDIAVTIRNPLWDWHIYLGFFLGALLLGRILIMILIEKKCPGRQELKNLITFKQLPSVEKKTALHYYLVKVGYAVFYLATALMVITGLMMNFKVDIGLSKNFVSLTKEIHEFMMWFFVIFISGHILGIVIAENTQDQGLVSDMIHGGK